MEIKPSTYIICATLAFLGILGTYIILELNNVDTGEFLVFLGGLIVLIPGTAAWKVSQNIKRDQIEVKKDTEEIKRQTNGPLTHGLLTVDNMGTRLAKAENNMELVRGELNLIRTDLNLMMVRVHSFLEDRGF